jgi:alanyl-tRNA synthetase
MDHAQQHTGQHLLSAVFLQQVQARTVSFHLGAESSTIDLMLAEGVERLSEAELAAVEAEANRLVYADRSMRPRWVEREQAQAMLERGELRKLPERVGRMRIVEMDGVEFNACGGTHVASTGAIGGLMLRKVEKAKKGWRVEFVCGLRAVRTARRGFEGLGAVAKMLSVGAADVGDRVSGLLEKNKALAKQVKVLERAAAEPKTELN